MAFVLELSVFSHHDDGDIIERHTLFSDPNAENVALLRDNVAEAFEMSGYQPQSRHDYEHYYVTPSDRETYAVGLQLIPTLFDEEPDPRNLSNTLSALTRFDLGTQTVPPHPSPRPEARPAPPHPVRGTPQLADASCCRHARRREAAKRTSRELT